MVSSPGLGTNQIMIWFGLIWRRFQRSMIWFDLTTISKGDDLIWFEWIWSTWFDFNFQIKSNHDGPKNDLPKQGPNFRYKDPFFMIPAPLKRSRRDESNGAGIIENGFLQRKLWPTLLCIFFGLDIKVHRNLIWFDLIWRWFERPMIWFDLTMISSSVIWFDLNLIWLICAQPC